MNRRLGLVALAVVSLLVLAGVAAAVPADRVLVVEDDSSGERLLTVPVETGTRVGLEYTHSVEKTRVLDEYTVRGDRLEMTRMEFESYGWGLPAGADVHRENGSFVFDPAGSYEEIYVKPGRVAGHKLHVGERTHDLVSLSGASTVRLSLADRSVLSATIDTLEPTHEP